MKIAIIGYSGSGLFNIRNKIIVIDSVFQIVIAEILNLRSIEFCTVK